MTGKESKLRISAPTSAALFFFSLANKYGSTRKKSVMHLGKKFLGSLNQ